MAAAKSIDERYQEYSNQLIEDFFNFTDPPRPYPFAEEFKYPTNPVPSKPKQKMERGQKGLDYVAESKQSVNDELTKVSDLDANTIKI